MGTRYEVQVWCVRDLIGLEKGIEGWGWETTLRTNSIRLAVNHARKKKKETGGAVRVIWR